MEQAIINVEGTTTIETAAAAKKLIGMLGNQNTCGYAGTGPSNLYEVLQAAGVSEAQVAREDITQKSTKTIPLRLERAVTQYGDFQFA